MCGRAFTLSIKAQRSTDKVVKGLLMWPRREKQLPKPEYHLYVKLESKKTDNGMRYC